jgi:LacI family transcriptional regulator, kdg operon repressor
MAVTSAADGATMSRRTPAAERPATGTRAVTISDVARHAGVSKTTVSRYLSGWSDILAEATWKQIEEAIATLHYKPSRIARGLKGGRTRLIGMVVADVTNPYSVAVLRGAEEACHRAGYVIALCNSNGSREAEKELLAELREYQVEGLILNLAEGGCDKEVDTIPDGLPVVLLDRTHPSGRFDFVGLNNVVASSGAVRHLVAHGFGDFALVTEPIGGVSVRLERALGFQSAVNSSAGSTGTVVEVDLHRDGDMHQALERFLDTPSSQPKAVIAVSGLVTLRVIQELQALDLRLPTDLGLVGFDELDWSSLVPPGITTIAQPTYEIGVTAVQNLLARLKGDHTEPRRTIFNGRLIERGSSAGCPRICCALPADFALSASQPSN